MNKSKRLEARNEGIDKNIGEVARVHGSGPRMQRQRYGDKGMGARARGQVHWGKGIAAKVMGSA